MNKQELKKLRDKYSLKNILSVDEYEEAKKEYTDVRVKPSIIINDVKLNERQLYKRNPNLKDRGVELEYTQEMVDEYIKCRDDPSYFINAYVKIVHVDFGLVPFNLRKFQEDIVEICSEFNKVILNTSRQVGKCCNYLINIDILESPVKNKINRSFRDVILSSLYNNLKEIKIWLVQKQHQGNVLKHL